VLFLGIEDMLHKIDRSDDFKNDLAILFAKFPMVVPQKIGVSQSIDVLFT